MYNEHGAFVDGHSPESSDVGSGGEEDAGEEPIQQSSSDDTEEEQPSRALPQTYHIGPDAWQQDGDKQPKLIFEKQVFVYQRTYVALEKKTRYYMCKFHTNGKIMPN